MINPTCFTCYLLHYMNDLIIIEIVFQNVTYLCKGEAEKKNCLDKAKQEELKTLLDEHLDRVK